MEFRTVGCTERQSRYNPGRARRPSGCFAQVALLFFCSTLPMPSDQTSGAAHGALPGGAGSHLRRREVFAWAMYDWANSAYSTISITVLVNYLVTDVLPSGHAWGEWLGDPGVVIWGYGIGLTMFVAALLSPVLGAIADAHASKRRWLTVTALTGAAASSLMFFATPDQPALFVSLFLLAHLAFELSFGFYNAFLPEIAGDEEMGRVSAWGYALGYLGGGVALALVIGTLRYAEALGLPTEDQFGKRLGLLIMGLWWGLFSLPTLLILRDKGEPSRERQPLHRAARQAFRDVGRTLRNVRRYRILAIFLLGFLVYNDGVQTVISQASVFAQKVLKMDAIELAKLILMIQFVALPGSMLVGWAADRFGQKRALIACLLVWIGILTGAFFITTTAQFWVMAFVTALVLGGIQSVSRSIMGLMTPERHTAEFFGFFNFSGKATSVFGPIFFSTILAATGNANAALGSLLVFFILGLAIVWPVNVARGQQEARAVETGNGGRT